MALDAPLAALERHCGLARGHGRFFLNAGAFIGLMVLSNALEGSNVDPVTQLVDLIRTQRAFEMNSQAFNSADETLQTVVNLGR